MTTKEKCELLRAMRQDIAQANGITLNSSECTFEGECPGYCPKCDGEAQFLDIALNRMVQEGKTIRISDFYYSNLIESVAYLLDDESEIICGEDYIEDEESTDFLLITGLSFSDESLDTLLEAELVFVKDLIKLSKQELQRNYNISEEIAAKIDSELRANGYHLREDTEEIRAICGNLPYETENEKNETFDPFSLSKI